MPDLESQLKTVLDFKLPNVSEHLPAHEFVLPRYDGYSIANVPATAGVLLGGALPGRPPLAEVVWQGLKGQTRCVLLIILDAMGLNVLQRHLLAQPNSALGRIA